MKRLYIIALFVFAGGFASAQENGNRDAQNRIVRGPYETNRFFDNIFVGVAGGVNLYFGENDSEGKFGKRLAPAMDIHVGKWFTPSIGARVGYAGLQAKGWTSAGTLYAKSADGGLFREKFGVMYLHADAMWNFSNAVSGYKESRTWNFVPFVGVGWARSYGNDAHDNEIGFDAGLLNVVRLCSSLDLTLEARCLLVNQRFDGVTGGRTGEGMLSVTAGLAYKFNRRGFVRASNVQPVDVTPYLDRIRNLEENNTDDAAARMHFIVKITTAVIASIGLLISLLAVGMLVLSVFLLLQKNRAMLADLIQLGYTRSSLGNYYIRLVATVNVAVLVSACAGVAACSTLWRPLLAGIGPEGASLLITIGILTAVMLLITLISAVIIRGVLRRI